MPEDFILKQKARISHKASERMILLFARYGNHYIEGSSMIQTKTDVINYYAQHGINFDHAVSKCRNFSNTVPLFENQIGGMVHTIGTPKVSRINLITGKEDLILEGPGSHTIHGYWVIFEGSANARDRAISGSSFVDCQSAIVQGIASIESYFTRRVEIWNETNPNSQLVDNKDSKVSLNDKFDKWVPTITGGRKIDKGETVDWQHFKILRAIRDNYAIHPKESGYAVSLAQLAEQINMFRTGIAGILMQLHALFEDPIPSIIIRARCAPDIEVVRR